MQARVKKYERTVTQTPHAVVVDIFWRPGDLTFLHDHRSANGDPLRGFVFVRTGRIFQILKDGTTTFHEAGDHLLEIDGGWHVVGNCDEDVAASTHVYFPSLVMHEIPYNETVRRVLKGIGIEL